MTQKKYLGICMDHSNAHLIEFSRDGKESNTIESQFTRGDDEPSSSSSENLRHNKENQQQSEYYKQLGTVIKNYTDVLLFGPTNAKSQLFNLLRDDFLFEKVKIEIRQTDKMSDTQQNTFVTEFFSAN